MVSGKLKAPGRGGGNEIKELEVGGAETGDGEGAAPAAGEVPSPPGAVASDPRALNGLGALLSDEKKMLETILPCRPPAGDFRVKGAPLEEKTAEAEGVGRAWACEELGPPPSICNKPRDQTGPPAGRPWGRGGDTRGPVKKNVGERAAG